MFENVTIKQHNYVWPNGFLNMEMFWEIDHTFLKFKSESKYEFF